VDGGLAYIRRVGNHENIIDMCEFGTINKDMCDND